MNQVRSRRIKMPRNDGNKTQSKATNKNNTKKPTNKGLQNNFGKPNDKNKKKNGQKPPTVKATTSFDTFVAKKPADKFGRAYEYKMSRLCANEILKECPSRMKPQQYLCDYVTEQYGLLGWCCKVIIEG